MLGMTVHNNGSYMHAGDHGSCHLTGAGKYQANV